MSLEEYISKRDFGKTNEPRGKVADKGGSNRFVVQRHAARNLHFDLRLEIGGVLKSWAIPKGPSLNPNDKRLAVETEDHPMEYLDFEGVIPKGNYGAGKMEIWDSGTFEPYSGRTLRKMYSEGDIKLKFHGGKLRGSFALVRTKLEGSKPQWLLVKKKDAFASDLDYDANLHLNPVEESSQSQATGTVALSVPVLPMLAEPGQESSLPNSKGWLHEIKWDGYRMLAHLDGSSAVGYSRNEQSFEDRFPSLLQALESIPHTAVLDGEVVCLDRKGIPQFQWLQHHAEDPKGELEYVVFDLLFLDGHSLTHLPLNGRKELLKKLVRGVSGVRYSEHVNGNGREFYKKIVAEGYEGIVSKKADSLYHTGSRTSDWIKFKPVETLEALICGYTHSESRPFGSLILGIPEGGGLRYIGNCGSGFTARQQRDLLGLFRDISRSRPVFDISEDLGGRVPNWVSPTFVAEVGFRGWTKEGKLRHPVFKALRHDKSTADLSVDAGQKRPSPTKVPEDALEINGRTVPVSNLEKILWPKKGIRKYDLIDYYLAVSEYILPFLIGRPQSLHRHPDGIGKLGFYQKDTPDYFPEWIETATIRAESADRDISYLLCQNEETLAYLANLACIELNPWHSRIGSLGFPDYAVIDLDPSEKNSFQEVVEVALEFKNLLDGLDVESCCKTSGASGLHIHLPMGAEYTYEEARNFCKLLCMVIQERMPKLTTMERKIKDRGNRIYLDYLQNREGQTIAAPYCLRPTPNATVSAPLLWKEVNPKLDKAEFNILTMKERAKRHPKLFSEVLGPGLDMALVLEKISQMQ